MSVSSYVLRRSLGLGKPRCRVVIKRGIRVPTEGGRTLATEHYAPRLEGPSPTLLMRSPYGIRGFEAVAELYAEHGYHVVLQACRGTGGSDGEFEPLRHERADGLATLAWLKAQPWYDGRLGTTGPSYLGYAQWAISDAMPATSALAIKVSSAEFRSVILPHGVFHLGLWLSWIQLIDGIAKGPLAFLSIAFRGGIDRITGRASLTLPLEEADHALTGHEVPFWRRWIVDAFREPNFWEPMDHTHRLGARTPPVLLVSGWYDIMIDQLLRDYETLRDAGARPQLKVGPWFHVSPELQSDGLRETLPFMDRMLRGEGEAPVNPVSLYITGAEEWRQFATYPPGPPDTQLWHLNAGGALSLRPAASVPPDQYRYDPNDPTPNLGGAVFAFTGAGPVDQAPLEARTDVLVYTSEPLFRDLTIIGNVRATLYARASLPDADFFVRLCDVDEKGVSINICDGIVRKTSSDPAVVDDLWKLNIRLHATAHCFGEGHRLRLIVASGAHPRYARNPGTSEPPGTATRLLPVDIEIFHDHERPSAIQLPIYEL